MPQTETAIPEAIEEPSESATLIYDIAAIIQRYVVLPSDEHALVLALWVIHTWTWQLFDCTPYLYINSSEPQCGKTRLIEILELLVQNPLRAASATPSALIRSIEHRQPTMLLDEVDTVWRPGARNELLRGVINDGYKRGGCFLRIQQQEPKAFATYCPKLLAGIFNGYMPDTIADRSIPVKLKRKDRHEQCEAFHSSQVANGLELNSILDRIEMFVEQGSKALQIQRPDPILAISDRQWEITEPLIAIAICLGVEEEARAAITAMFAERAETPNVQTQLLEDIELAFAGRPKMFTADLVEALGQPWSGKLLANWLSAYNISPGQIRIGNQTGSGYKAEQFSDLWTS